MAKNMKYRDANQLSVVCSDPAVPLSGDPVRFGDLCGVALKDELADGTASVQFGGAFDLSVKAIDGGGNSAVVAGDTIYYVDADTPKLSKKTTGKKFGTALAAVTSGATATITVRVNGAV